MGTFTSWLAQQLKDKDISMRELARMSNISDASISRVLSGKQAVTTDFCKAIAVALDESPNDLLVMAGIIKRDKPADLSEEEAEVLTIYHSLSDFERREWIAIGRLKQGRGN